MTGRSAPLTAVVLVLSVGIAGIGCDKAHTACEAIELGRPLAVDNLLAREGRAEKQSRGWSEYTCVSIPLLYASLRLSAVEDQAGNVVAKWYDAWSWGHGLVCIFATGRSAFEVQVPPEAFHDPPPDWSPPQPVDTWQLQRLANWLAPLRREAGPDGTSQHSAGPATVAAKHTTTSITFQILRRRLRQRVLTKVEQGQTTVPVDLAKDLDLTDLRGRPEIDTPNLTARVMIQPQEKVILEVSQHFPLKPPTNVLDYLLFIQRLEPAIDSSEEKTCPGLLLGLLYCPYMFMYGIGGQPPSMHDLAKMPNLLSGVTDDGYDRYAGSLLVGLLRIRNMGNRRIRVDTSHCRAVDPIFLPLYCTCSMVLGSLF